MDSNNMQDVIRAELLGKIDYDNGVADAARVSMAKKAELFAPEENKKLMAYLHRLLHWSPYGHQRDTFKLYITDRDWLVFLENAILAGFSFCRGPSDEEIVADTVFLNGSLWAWYENLNWLPVQVKFDVIDKLSKKYPVAGKILWPAFHENVNGFFSGHYAELVELPVDINTARMHYLTFRIKAPISLARQLVKHQVHLCWNEESRRYITDDVEFYQPELRAKAEKIKQGSKDELMENHNWYEGRILAHYHLSKELYNDLLSDGCAPEQARNVLPIGSVTNWIWTGSLDAWHRVCRQRLDSHAQREAQFMARQINDAIANTYPDTWKEMWDSYAR